MRPLDPERSPSPMVGVRLPRDVHQRAIELAGDGKGALSAFVRSAVLDRIEAVLDRIERENQGPPEPGG